MAREERPPILGIFGGMTLIGIILNSCEPDYDNVQVPKINFDGNRMVFSDPISKELSYVDIKPLGSVNYVIDSRIEREPNRRELDRYAFFYRAAKEQGLVE